jgi:hypothetical protein
MECLARDALSSQYKNQQETAEQLSCFMCAQRLGYEENRDVWLGTNGGTRSFCRQGSDSCFDRAIVSLSR